MSNGHDVDPDYKVGPGRPPRDKQFKRGAPSPNPLGRPPKPRVEKSLFASLDPFAAMLVQFDNKLLRSRGESGEPIELTCRQIALQRLYEKAIRDSDLPSLKLYMQMTGAAHAKAREFKTEMLAGATAHINRYLPSFLAHERAGKELPDVHPDPRDIHIDNDGNVNVEGPTNRFERQEQAEVLELQQSVIEVLQTLRRRKLAPDVGARLERKLKRRLSKINAALPTRLRRQSWRSTIRRKARERSTRKCVADAATEHRHALNRR